MEIVWALITGECGRLKTVSDNTLVLLMSGYSTDPL